MSIRTAEIGIVGAGPAGARAAELLADAGAASRVRRAVRPGFRPMMAPTRVAYPDLGDSATDEALFRFVSGMDGYVWDFPRTGHRSVGAGVNGDDASREVMDGAVDDYWSEATGCELNGARRTGAVIGTAGRPHAWVDVGDIDWALLGDAAGFADPVTGEGIRNALRSAACLVDAYRSDGSFASYPDRAEATLERGFRLSRRIHALLYDGRAAAWLVGAAARIRYVRALVAAVSNGGNEHELGGTLLDRWRAACRDARAA
jgi:flavin-dependent dehydrogenase